MQRETYANGPLAYTHQDTRIFHTFISVHNPSLCTKVKQENTVAAFNKQTLNQHAKRTNAFNVVDSCGAYGCTQRVRGGAYLVKCTLCVHAQSH